jgi:hypothetical protein
MKLDLDLVVHDFLAAFRADQPRAAAALQSLLLDEKTCRARVEHLRRVQAHSGRPWPRTDFRRDIRALTTLGTLPALEQGVVTPERLTALTCQPDALWDAHLALTAEEPEADDSTKASDDQDTDDELDQLWIDDGGEG